MSYSLQPHRLKHTKLTCPSLSPRVCSNSCPLNWWCYATLSSSATLFSFCLQSFPESGSFPMSWLFSSGGQNIGAWASASVPPMNIQGWFPVGLTWFSLLAVQETLQQCSPAPQFESINSLMLSILYSISHIHTWLLEETIALSIWTFVCKVMSL